MANEPTWEMRISECPALVNGPLVYLCGTITPNAIHRDWRDAAEWELADYGIGCLSPVRGKNPADWTPDGLEGKASVAYSNGGFVARDRRDVERCDALLLAFTKDMDPGRQSLGTWCELGWATAWNIPVVVWTDMPEIEKHPFIYRQAAKVCGTLDEALEYLEFLLG